jgi:hypothetical protein
LTISLENSSGCVFFWEQKQNIQGADRTMPGLTHRNRFTRSELSAGASELQAAELQLRIASVCTSGTIGPREM